VGLRSYTAGAPCSLCTPGPISAGAVSFVPGTAYSRLFPSRRREVPDHSCRRSWHGAAPTGALQPAQGIRRCDLLIGRADRLVVSTRKGWGGGRQLYLSGFSPAHDNKINVVEVVGGLTQVQRGDIHALAGAALPFVAGALLSQTQVISAQSSNNYARCVITDSSRNCYYPSQRQCLEANSGISSLCVPNPSYRPPQAVQEPTPSASDSTPVANTPKRRQSQ
jgi:hypothetical protein